MGRVLVAGCGFVGRAVARALHAQGWDVQAITHSAESAAALAVEPFPVRTADLTSRAQLSALQAGPLDSVVHCASSGRGGVEAYRTIYLEGARALDAVLQPARLLFTSSTSVYAQTSGEWVTEFSAAEPGRDTGRVLRETEEFVLARGGCVARIAGIYGPGRSVLLRKFLSGEAVIEGDGSRWINQAHRDDIAAALALLVQAGARGIYNVSDDQPVTQADLYRWLAEYFQRPLPPSGPIDLQRKRGVTHKRVSNARLRDLGWTPRHPSFQDAVPELVAAGGL